MRVLSCLAIPILYCTAIPLWGGVIGQQVTGDMDLGFNGFAGDPAPGFLNATEGATVTIDGITPAFGFDDGLYQLSADFQGSRLIVEMDSNHGVFGSTGSYLGVPLSFTLATGAFTSLIEVSDDFYGSGVNGGLSNGVIQVQIPSGTYNTNQEYTAVFDFSTVPEPSSWLLTVIGIAFLATIRKSRRS